MRQVQSIRESLIENPFASILLAALVIAEYGNYQRGRELARVCELLGPTTLPSPSRGRHEKKSTTST